MKDSPKPTDALLLGRRALEGRTGVEMLADVSWDAREERWVLPVRLLTDEPTPSIPQWTDWYVLIDEHYPQGDIEIHPARHGGITDTYPHQSQNSPGDTTRPWRNGKLCLRTGLAGLRLRARPEVPWSAEARLDWYVARAREWLEAATRGELSSNGDAFELPDLPVSGSQQVVFREGPETLEQWARIPDSRGWVELIPVPGNPRVLAVRAFYSLEGRWLFSSEWGDLLRLSPRGRRFRVPWMRCEGLPHLPPHAAPSTWPELEQAAGLQGWALREDLHTFASRLRDEKRHLCLVGFPIPGKVGGADARMHWWALRLPVFANPRMALRGYPHNAKYYWIHDQVSLFERKHRVDWLRTENWAPEDLRSRGALPASLCDSWVLLLGAGSLGSAMAELLVRGGVSRLVIMDPEIIEAGNLVRHTLDLGAVRHSKAHALATHLRHVNPDARIHSFDEALSPNASERPWIVSRCETIIDCTASDGVIESLGLHPWGKPVLFFSASFGVGARRLLCFSATGTRFPTSDYWSRTRTWLDADYEELKREELPREGIGCWHPVFPARADDVMLVAAIAVKSLVRASEKRPDLQVDTYERDEDDNGFRGVNRVSPVEAHAGP